MAREGTFKRKARVKRKKGCRGREGERERERVETDREGERGGARKKQQSCKNDNCKGAMETY